MNVDTIIMIVYLLAMLAIGVYCSKFIKSFDDFFVAGRRLGFWMSLGTMASIFVGGSAIGVAGYGHQYGLYGIMYYACFALGFLLLAKTFVSPLRSLEQYTIADIFEARYDTRVRLVASVVILLAWLCFFAALVVGGARVIEVTLGWKLTIAILATAGVFTVYTTVGGMWAVTLTDFVQFIILVIGIIAICPIALYNVGGLGEMMANVPDSYTSVIPTVDGSQMLGMGMIVAILVLTTPTTFVAPDVYLRIWCMSDDRTAKKTLYVLAGLLIFFGVIITLTGMASYVLFPDVDHELALPLMAQKLLPAGISGVMLVALLAASVSGAVPEVIVCASILARDIYQSFVNPNADDKKMLQVSRVLTAFCGVLGMVLAVLIPGVMDLTFHCYRIFIPAALPAIVAAFYSRRTSATSALISMIIGPVISMACMFLLPSTYLTYCDPVIPGLAASVIAMLVANHFFEPSEKSVAFYDKVQAHLKAEKEAKLAAKGNK